MTDHAIALLEMLDFINRGGGFAMSCEGEYRPLAHELEANGLAQWHGESFGSSFWSITAAGEQFLGAMILELDP